MLINYLGNLCNFYSSIKPRSLFSSSLISSSGEIKKQGLLLCSTWNAISTQTSRPRDELIFTALAAMHISKHDRLESTSSECIQEAPYCGIPQIPIKLQKRWSHQYNSALCQHCKQKVLVYISDLSVLNQHCQETLLLWASYLWRLIRWIPGPG